MEIEPVSVDNWSNREFCVVLVVSFDVGVEFKDVKTSVICSEPDTTLSPNTLRNPKSSTCCDDETKPEPGKSTF